MLTAQDPALTALSSVPSEHDSIILEEGTLDPVAHNPETIDNPSGWEAPPPLPELKKRPPTNSAWKSYINAIESIKGASSQLRRVLLIIRTKGAL